MYKITVRIFAVCLLITLSLTGQTFAQTSSTYTVKAGETLFSIAQKEGVSIDQIRKWNHLSDSSLSVGQTLVIKKQAQSKGARSGMVHTVKPNETLYSISKEYNVGIDEIKQWNNLGGQAISVGDKLSIYPQKSKKTASRPSPNTSGNVTYTVKSGDSLFRIASAHNMSVSRLKALNNLSSNNIKVGQKLELQPTNQPPSLSIPDVQSSSQGQFILYTVKKSQSRKQLLDTFRMDEAEFMALNPGLQTTFFHKGENINLLAPATRSFKNPYVVNSSSKSLGDTRVIKYKIKAVTPTASGELYNPDALTAAHANMALGSVIFLQNSQNNRGVFVRVNDRTTGGGLKVSDAVWKALGLSGNHARITMYRSDE